MRSPIFCKFSLFILLAVSVQFIPRIHAQNLTLEGQTGGFITPTVVNVAPTGAPPVLVPVPVNLEARHVVGVGLSIRP